MLSRLGQDTAGFQSVCRFLLRLTQQQLSRLGVKEWKFSDTLCVFQVWLAMLGHLCTPEVLKPAHQI